MQKNESSKSTPIATIGGTDNQRNVELFEEMLKCVPKFNSQIYSKISEEMETFRPSGWLDKE